MKKYKIAIEGMHCAGNVENSVRKVTGVKNVTVSAVTSTAFVECAEWCDDTC